MPGLSNSPGPIDPLFLAQCLSHMSPEQQQAFLNGIQVAPAAFSTMSHPHPQTLTPSSHMNIPVQGYTMLQRSPTTTQPPSQGVENQPSVPAIRPYSSLSRGENHYITPNSPVAQNIANIANSGTPFQGIPSLGRGVVSQVNSERLSSSRNRRVSAVVAAASGGIPQRTRRQPSNRHVRGAAVNPPLLPTIRSQSVDSCYIVQGVNTMLRLRIKVYPPKRLPESHVYHYRFLKNTFVHHLRQFGLIFEYDIDPNTRVSALVQQVVDDLQSGPHSYTFATNASLGSSSSSLQAIGHEALPIHPLKLHDRGRPSKAEQIRLVRYDYNSDTTVHEMAQQKCYISHPSCLDEDGRLSLQFMVTRYPCRATIVTGVNSNGAPQQSKEISKKIYSMFHHDRSLVNNHDSEDYSSDSASESSSTTPTVISGASRAITISNQAMNTLSLESETPSGLWNTQWNATATPSEYEDIVIESLSGAVYELANAPSDHQSQSSPKELVVKGSDIRQAGDDLICQLEVAVESKDFTDILSSDRTFKTLDESGFLRSVGVGVEREVLFTTFDRMAKDTSKYLTLLYGGYHSVATTLSQSNIAHCLSDKRRVGLGVLGALTSMMIINNMNPDPISPVLLQYFIHDCNIHSIHPDFLKEWHPDLFQLLQTWRDIGPTGDLSMFQTHFSIYHDIQISTLQDRDELGHSAMGLEMLHRAIIGREMQPSNHAEFQAFLVGFYLPCRNGFQLDKVLRSFAGGSEAFISLLWTSQITDFEAFKPFFKVKNPTTAIQRQAFGQLSITFSTIISDFLRGRGVPCPSRFETIKPFLDPVINLEKVNEPSFRSKMFCWAASGCPTVDTHSRDIIEVYLIDDNDSNYATPYT